MPGQKILKACKIRGLSLSKACAIAGINYSTLHSQIGNQRQIPFSTVDRFRVALNFPIGFSINKNTLINHELLLERIDLFYPPKPGDIMIRPYSIGANSLVVRYINLTSLKDYTETIAKLERPLLEQIAQDHIDAASQNYMVANKTIDQTVNGIRITGTYWRLIAPVKDVDGQAFSLVFSKRTQFSLA